LPPVVTPAGGKRKRVRRSFGRITREIDGVEWTFTLQADGVYAHKKHSRRSEQSSYHDLLATVLKQKTLNLI